LKTTNVGGQAVIEGVMMKSEHRIATAVRKANGTILLKSGLYQPFFSRFSFLKWPFVRGSVNLIEMLKIGFEALNFSAEEAVKDEQAAQPNGNSQPAGISKTETAFSFILAFGLAILLFVALPMWIAKWMGLSDQQLYFNVIDGLIRIVFFVAYVLGISLMKDIRRVFEYHGAEHKSIACYEAGLSLTPANAKQFSTIHPRCGTSFLMVVLISAIIIFAVVDTGLHAWNHGELPFYIRFPVHLALLPFVAGVGYEIIRLGGKFQHHPLTKFLLFPGLALQKITTSEPDAAQLEVAIASLKSAIGDDSLDPKIQHWENDND